ncbi:ABC transporter substrate-binding protein [Methylotuvimicrobium buryatense]|uniref:ABC transporter substrate-binding protein n=1 Tax=Methylotuvimicrobium buryatense TaxID=95641 RepID=A0A4P9UU33_METBY|nr:ABC transporter substrate-binding protein [Methylotuvimicrobium buryatense]QCW84123.1 ABC transporter substrate-binding protein [Methylotuvimicrobium buryatense]
MKKQLHFFWLGLLFSLNSFAAEPVIIRLGILEFGTAAWEVQTLQSAKLDESGKFELAIHPLANPEAGKIALQSGAVDIIVSDWIWVSKLRSTGADYTFYPYSNVSGGLVVTENSPIKTLNDLKDKRLGIAGGELDKNGLLMQAAFQQQGNSEIASSIEKVYGAPPLLNQQMLNNRLDAVMTYWHFAAKLEAQGYRQIIDGQALIKTLGIEEEVPALGYVFKQSWAEQHKQVLTGFLQAARQARALLCESDEAWQKILPLTQTDDTHTQSVLRKRYCEGAVKQWGDPEKNAANRIYRILKTVSHNKLTGKDDNLQPGTFWAIDQE